MKAPLRPLVLKVHHRRPLLVPRVGEGTTSAPSGGTATSPGAAEDGVTSEVPMHLGGSSTVEVDPLPVAPLAQSKGNQVGVATAEPSTALQSEEAGSSSVAVPAPSALPAGRPRVLDDGPEADG